MPSIATRVFLIALLICARAVSAAPFTRIHPSIGPNPNSNAFVSYSANAIAALLDDESTKGTAGTPEYYSRIEVSTAPPSSILSTSQPSWNGVANPSPPYQNETGNWLYFGLKIQSNLIPFSLSELGLEDFFLGNGSTCPAPCFSEYRPDLMGISFGLDGVLGGEDDQVYISGTSAKTINLLLYVGNALAVDADAFGSGQAALDAAIGAILQIPDNQRFALNRYFLGGEPIGDPYTSSTVLIVASAVPEPATYLTVSMSLAAMIVCFCWRRDDD